MDLYLFILVSWASVIGVPVPWLSCYGAITCTSHYTSILHCLMTTEPHKPILCGVFAHLSDRPLPSSLSPTNIHPSIPLTSFLHFQTPVPNNSPSPLISFAYGCILVPSLSPTRFHCLMSLMVPFAYCILTQLINNTHGAMPSTLYQSVMVSHGVVCVLVPRSNSR